MSRKLDKVLREALELEQEDRAKLVGHLIESLDPGIEEGAAEAWAQEISRRAARDRFRCRYDDSVGRGEEATRPQDGWLSTACGYTLRRKQMRNRHAWYAARSPVAVAQFLINLDIAMSRIRGSPER